MGSMSSHPCFPPPGLSAKGMRDWNRYITSCALTASWSGCGDPGYVCCSCTLVISWQGRVNDSVNCRWLVRLRHAFIVPSHQSSFDGRRRQANAFGKSHVLLLERGRCAHTVVM